ncbi:hypothetical protein PLICRDRAFT_97935 [Plicaturopsis crispa FD-325 SS-3]|nr:hypothetical protein PLICRDRAFT_97935 [Plicaturopsis crispa FD-325 SS-3]
MFLPISSCLLVLASLFTSVASTDSVNPVPHIRSYFYVGATYVPEQGSNASIAHGQMYVEHLVPANVSQPLPLVLIHGKGMTGTNFLNTPDGRTGWADYFMSKGFELYIVDQPGRARSPWQQTVDGPVLTFDTNFFESYFTATEKFNLWPQASLHTQWPGNGTKGDQIFDNFYFSGVQSISSDIETSQLMLNAGPKLMDKIGPAIVMTHSQSGQLGWIIADARPKLVKAVIALEPSGPPFVNTLVGTGPGRPYGLTETPIAYSPPIANASELRPVNASQGFNFTCYKQAEPARKLANLAQVPVLMVTSEASFHAVYDNCTAAYMKQGGVDIEHINLPEVGIHGNGHMMFMEKNGLDIAENVIHKWLAAHFP